MSNTPLYADSSASPLERRLHVRQQVSALAYVDIGTDNGGIVLNLNDEGMGLQAAGPLDNQEDISLRIQLPHSRTRIDASAKIVWLSESNRRAGVRFVDMPSEGRAQIHEWIRSQISPNAPSEGSLGQPEAASEPRQTRETVRESRKDKWLRLMAEFELPEPNSQEPSQTRGGTETRHKDPVTREASASFPAPGIVPGQFAERGKPPSAARPPKEVPPHGAPYRPRTVSTKSGLHDQPNGQTSDYAPIIAPNNLEASVEGVLDWPISTSPTVPATVSQPPARPRGSAEPSASAVGSTANSAPTRPVTIPVVSAATKRKHARNWVAVAVLFALISVLCFCTGTWVGPLGTRLRPAQTPAGPANIMSTAEPGRSGSTRRKANELASASTEKGRAGHVAGNSARENRKRKLAPSASSPIILPVRQNTAPTPAKQSAATLTAANPPESISPPAPDNPAAEVPSPSIVAGRTLRPTDRFNPCHLTYRVEPAYPLEAQQQRIEGVVKIHQVIGTDGTVRSLKLLSGPPLLAPAAMDAARYWRYVPALLNGQPVDTEQDIEIDFRLPH